MLSGNLTLHLNDSENAWEKVLLSGETKLEFFGNSLTCCVRGREMLSQETPSPQSSTEVETLCFEAGYLLVTLFQDKFSAKTQCLVCIDVT